jgi:cytochrome c oxidase assembly factor CtaG
MFWEELVTFLHTIRTAKKTRRSTILLLLPCVFVAAVTFLPSRCLATIGRYTWEGFTKYATEMSSGAMIYIPRFVKIVSAIQKSMEGGYTDTHRAG